MSSTALFPGKRRKGVDLCEALDDIRQSLHPLTGRGCDAWHPVRIRPCLKWAMVPAPRKKALFTESAAVGAWRLHKKMWPELVRPKAGPGLVDGADSDATARDAPHPPRRNGFNGLTSRGAMVIEDLCALSDREKGLFAFWTVTLPPDAATVMEATGVEWSKFQDTLRRRFSEALERKALARRYAKASQGRHPEWFFVVEAQKNGRPHLHFVYRARWHRGQTWFLAIKELDRLIKNALRTVTGQDFSVERAGNVQRVKRGLGRYLSKYLGKGRGSGQVDLIERAGYGHGMIPRQWWGCAISCKRKLDRYVFEIPSALVHELSHRWRDLGASGIVKAKVVNLPGEGAPSVVVGRWSSAADLRVGLLFLVSCLNDARGLSIDFGWL